MSLESVELVRFEEIEELDIEEVPTQIELMEDELKSCKFALENINRVGEPYRRAQYEGYVADYEKRLEKLKKRLG